MLEAERQPRREEERTEPRANRTFRRSPSLSKRPIRDFILENLHGVNVFHALSAFASGCKKGSRLLATSKDVDSATSSRGFGASLRAVFATGFVSDVDSA